MNKVIIALVFGVVLLGLVSCNKNKRFEINTNVPLKKEFKIKRFDLDFMAVNPKNIIADIEKLRKKYPAFTDLYLANVLGLDPKDTASLKVQLGNFLTNKTYQEVHKKVAVTFQDVSAIEKKISDAYAYIQHYFPEMKTPDVYFFVSGFNQSVFLSEQALGVGADMYLGSDYPMYAEVTYDYMTINMRPEGVAPDLISALLFSNFPPDMTSDRLLENMLYRGKIMYILSVIMPNELPNELMGYTKTQWEWCRKYEKEIWDAIVKQGDLYTTDMLLIRKYVNDAPFTAPVTQESPGRLGTWVGIQIIQSYMDKHKDVSLMDLVRNNNYQQILNESGYRP